MSVFRYVREGSQEEQQISVEFISRQSSRHCTIKAKNSSDLQNLLPLLDIQHGHNWLMFNMLQYGYQTVITSMKESTHGKKVDFHLFCLTFVMLMTQGSTSSVKSRHVLNCETYLCLVFIYNKTDAEINNLQSIMISYLNVSSSTTNVAVSTTFSFFLFHYNIVLNTLQFLHLKKKQSNCVMFVIVKFKVFPQGEATSFQIHELFNLITPFQSLTHFLSRSQECNLIR